LQGKIAYTLLDIFIIFGAPSVLQSDNGRKFSNLLIEVCSMWPELKIVHGNHVIVKVKDLLNIPIKMSRTFSALGFKHKNNTLMIACVLYNL